MKSYIEHGFEPVDRMDDPSKYGDVINSFIASDEACIKKVYNSKEEAKKVRNSIACLLHNRNLSDKAKCCLRGHTVFVSKKD